MKNITSQPFGVLPDGQTVQEFTFCNSHGIEIKVINFGGIITAINQPDDKGNIANIVLGYDNLQDYLNDSVFLGAIIGRYANRIENGRFSLEGNTYQLDCNNGSNHLHGGHAGFNTILWQAEVTFHNHLPALKLTHISADGDQGYPGNLHVTVIYQLTDNNRFHTYFSAYSDKTTIVNFTQHSYFNLHACNDILSHEIYLNADAITPISDNFIPLENNLPVDKSPFDFRTTKPIGHNIHCDHPQLTIANGYDHNFILNKTDSNNCSLAATVSSPTTSRKLHVFTTEPGLQFYTGNFLDGNKGNKNFIFTQHSGLCLEPQHFPNSPNRPDFPSTELHPGEHFSSHMFYEFL